MNEGARVVPIKWPCLPFCESFSIWSLCASRHEGQVAEEAYAQAEAKTQEDEGEVNIELILN